MKTKIPTVAALLCLLTLNAQLSTLLAQGTSFTYQGRLNDDAGPASGIYDLRFTIYDALAGGSVAGGPLTNGAVGASNGLFTTTLDFGLGVFHGGERWLDIEVRTNGSVSFTPLVPRQPITATPYAIFSSAAGSVSNGVIQNPSFLGTIGNIALELSAGNARALRLEPTANGAPNVIGGSPVNHVDAGVFGATIGGGGAVDYFGISYSNRVSDNFGTVGGGLGNVVQGFGSVVAGGVVNYAGGGGASIGGGIANNIQGGAHYSAISGGNLNLVQSNAQYSYIGGGSGNLVQAAASYSSIAGGEGNTNGASHSVLGGGRNNSIEPFCDLSVIGGGWFNWIQGGADQSVIAGGNAGKIQAGARESFIGGGFDNIIQTNAGVSFIGGGVGNRVGINSSAATIGGGGGNAISNNASGATIAGGSSNAVSNNAANATIGGGFDNTVTVRYATVGGGYQNFASGNFNVSNGDSATVAGGYQNAAAGNNAVVAGGFQNYARGDNAAVVGGWLHTNLTGFGFIGGGQQHLIEPFSRFSVVAGGDNNTIRSNSTHAVISGGQANVIGTNALYAVVPGGSDNLAAGSYSFAAGRRAKARHPGAFVWADSTNADFSSSSSNQFLIRASGGVGIGVTNPSVALEVAGAVKASAFQGMGAPLMFSTVDNQPLEFKVNGVRALRLEPTTGTPNVVGGFTGNFVSNGVVGATIAGGGRTGGTNTVSADYGAIGGGYGNIVEAVNTTIGGGRQNSIGANSYTAAIAGGDRNVIEADAFGTTIAGGAFNRIQAGANGAAIGGGGQNLAGGDYSVVAGGSANTNLGYISSIAGGFHNQNLGALYASMGGGVDNVTEINAFFAVLSGGNSNRVASQTRACGVLSGERNLIEHHARGSVIAGGMQNEIDQFAEYASLLGGSNNLAFGSYSAVAGGLRNQAIGLASVVPGGSDNRADGDYSFAGGRRARAFHDGCFVWADSTEQNFSSTTSNQFLVRASFTGINRATAITGADVFTVEAPVNGASYGGMYINTTSGSGLPFYGYAQAGSAVAYHYVDGSDGNKWKLNVGGDSVTVTPFGDVGIGTTGPAEKLHVNGNILASGTITPNSDRNAKTDLAPIDSGEVLERVAKLPIQQWRFKTEAETVKHVGPMAQDFHAAFGVGAHETAIATVDADGVALAAIQGLNQKVEQQRTELKQKDAEISALEQRLARLEQLLARSTPTPAE